MASEGRLSVSLVTCSFICSLSLSLLSQAALLGPPSLVSPFNISRLMFSFLSPCRRLCGSCTSSPMTCSSRLSPCRRASTSQRWSRRLWAFTCPRSCPAWSNPSCSTTTPRRREAGRQGGSEGEEEGGREGGWVRLVTWAPHPWILEMWVMVG